MGTLINTLPLSWGASFPFPAHLAYVIHRGNSTFMKVSRFGRCSDHLWAAKQRQDDACTFEGRMLCSSVLARWRLAQATMQAQLTFAGDTPEARRAEHFFSEAERVARGQQLWRAGDLPALGLLINASGSSSADNYEVHSIHRIPLPCRLVSARANWSRPKPVWSA